MDPLLRTVDGGMSRRSRKSYIDFAGRIGPVAHILCTMTDGRRRGCGVGIAAMVIALALWIAALASCDRASSPQLVAQPAHRTDSVILVTLDGARTQEIFGGLDLDILRSTLRKQGNGENVENVEKTRAY